MGDIDGIALLGLVCTCWLGNTYVYFWAEGEIKRRVKMIMDTRYCD